MTLAKSHRTEDDRLVYIRVYIAVLIKECIGVYEHEHK